MHIPGRTLFIGAFVGLLTFGGQAAQGASLTAQQILSSFNVVVFGNDTATNSDVQGAAIVGGNLGNTGAPAANFYSSGTTLPTGWAALTIFGNASGNGINMNSGGRVYIGGTNTEGSINPNGALESFSYAPPNPNVVNVQTTLSNLSTTLAGMSGTTTSASGNGVSFSPGYTNNMAIIDLTAAQISGAGPSAIKSYIFSVVPSGAQTVIFNVSGTNVNFNIGAQGNATSAGTNVIWNLYQATNVTFNQSAYGTVLAPLASATGNQSIYGDLVVNTLTSMGQVDTSLFAGTLPGFSAAPEPDSLVMLGAGLAAVAMGIRRRKLTLRSDD
jgi:choice-of-anchor A domain-containing protein